jgi:excisionase family DNA binding protein
MATDPKTGGSLQNSADLSTLAGGTPVSLITISELSKKIGKSPSTLYKLTMRKEIPYIKLGGAVRFDEQRIDAWILSHAVEPVK